jgi:hypothetical protein
MFANNSRVNSLFFFFVLNDQAYLRYQAKDSLFDSQTFFVCVLQAYLHASQLLGN